MKRKQIVVDPGHGGDFGGRVYSDAKEGTTKEKDINLKAAGLLKYYLEQNLGVEVIMTREADTHFSDDPTQDLEARCHLEKIILPECFISIHCNGFNEESVNGFEVFTSVGETRSDALAECVIMAVKENMPEVKIRSDQEDGDLDREAHFYVLKHTAGPAILIELGFLTNKIERQRLKNAYWLDSMCHTLASGVAEWIKHG